MTNVTSPATTPRDRPPAGAIRVVVAVPHPMLRTAIAALIDSDADLTLAGTTADVLGTARCLRAERPDVLLIQRRLALSAIGTIRELQSLSPGVAVLVVGMETDTAYETVSRAAGAVGFVALDAPAEELLAAVKDAPGPPRWANRFGEVRNRHATDHRQSRGESPMPGQQRGEKVD